MAKFKPKKAVVYTSTAIPECPYPAFNASAFPCHDPDTRVIYLNGYYPEIEALCRDAGLEVHDYRNLKEQ